MQIMTKKEKFQKLLINLSDTKNKNKKLEKYFKNK